MKEWFWPILFGGITLYCLIIYHERPGVVIGRGVNRWYSGLSQEEVSLARKVFRGFDSKEMKYALEFSAAQADAGADCRDKANPDDSDEEVGLDILIAVIKAGLSVSYSGLSIEDQAFLSERDAVWMEYMTELAQLRTAIKRGEVSSQNFKPAFEKIKTNIDKRMNAVEAKYPDVAKKFGRASRQKWEQELKVACEEGFKKRKEKFKEKYPNPKEIIQNLRAFAELCRDLARAI